MIDIQHPEYSIVVRATIPEDAYAIYEIRRSLEVARWQYRLPLSDTALTLARNLEAANTPNLSYYYWSILNCDRVIGHLSGVRFASAACKLGFNLHADFWGRGIMQRSLRVVMDALYTDHNVCQIVCDSFRKNVRAMRLLTGLGFVLETITWPERLAMFQQIKCFKRIARFRHLPKTV